MCGAKDQYGDNCEVCGSTYAPTDLIDPYSVLTGVRPELRQSEHFFSGSSDLRCVDFLRRWTAENNRHGEPQLQPEVYAKTQEWLGPGGKGLADWDISRDAPYFGIPIPDAPGKFFYVWLDAPLGYLASLKAYFDSGKAAANGEARTFDAIRRRRRCRADSLHRQGHRLPPHTVLAGDAAFFGPQGCPTTSTCTASSPSAARR